MTATGAKDFWAAETLTVPMVRSLSDGVGYLKVSGSSGGDPDQTRAYASGLYARLATTAGAARCGFVIDLRENTGGNTWPLVAGLRPLLGGEPDGRPDPPPGSGSPWVATIAPREAPESLKGLEFVRVAVLIGPGTVSSAVTNAFRRRLQTRSFGQPTTGVPSANSLLPLSDGAMILLTTATIADPTGKRYGARVEPDEVISAPVRPERDGDPTLSAAVGWLKQSRTCGASR